MIMQNRRRQTTLSNILKLLQKAIRNPGLVANKLLRKFGKRLSDEQYIRLQYRFVTGKKLNLANPTTYNEKIQWLKVYGFKPEYTQMADKYRAREYITKRLRPHFENPEQFLVPLLGVWDTFDDIDFDALPGQFVLKTDHDSGTVVICADKQKFDKATAKDKLTKSLNRNFYWAVREPCYKDIEPQIIAEELLGTNFDTSQIVTPIDYKIHCSNGVPQFIQVIGDRDFKNHTGKAAFYSPHWKRLETVFYDYPAYECDIPMPSKLGQMLEIASILSGGITYCRIDLYEVSGQVKCGEITFYPLSGMYTYPPGKEHIDLELGRMIGL
jgi:hypothetical protein